MNLPETAQLLTMIAAFSNRTVDKSAVIAWQSVLGDVDLADAEEAVRQHYAEHTEWLMPAHIRATVRDMVNQREMAARHTGWAPGQAGVPKDQAMPEIAGPIAEGELTPTVRALLDSVRAMLPEGSREALMPRTVDWERQHRAYLRSHSGEPNPLYRPGSAGTETGILPNAHRCADCLFTTADADRMDGHLRATDHRHEGTFGTVCGFAGHPATSHVCQSGGVPYVSSYYDTQATAGASGERAPLRECVVDGDGHCQTHDRHVSSCPMNGRD